MKTRFCAIALPPLVAVAMLAISGCAGEEPTQPNGNDDAMRGTIIGGLGGPMAGVTVNAFGSFGNRSTTTDRLGTFSFADIPIGLANVIAFRGADTVRALINIGSTEADSVVMRLAVKELAWSDEFEGTTLDRSKWITWNRDAGINNEIGYFSDDEVWVENGHLRMRSQRRSIGGMQYSTGAIITRGSDLYGRFEYRAKLPGTQGLHSGYWMYPVDSIKPYCELDIVEILGGSSTTAHFTNHYMTDASSLGGAVRSVFTGPDFAADYHTFRVDWFPGEYQWFVDGIMRFRTTIGVADRNMIQLISSHVGGNWPGNPDSTTVFPQYHDVEFVRVYRWLE